MRILLSNDDGYRAPGLAALAAALTPDADVSVVAPEQDRSGASNSLTLNRPIRARQGENGFLACDGTPTDCVHLAITGLMDDEPDMVIAGINAGANMGDDVLYSGTVAAAMEGRFLGYPAIAMSLASHDASDFNTAAIVAAELVQRIRRHPIANDVVLNVNVPAGAKPNDLRYAVTRLGQRHKAKPVVRAIDPRGEPIYWVGAPGTEQDAGPGTDFHAIRNGMVSITPLHFDLTRHNLLDDLGHWLSHER